MNKRKDPLRMCVVTREKMLKKDLIRVVRTPNGEVIVDLTGKANGRGCYLKKDLMVIDKAEKSKVLERILEANVESKVYMELKNIIK